MREVVIAGYLRTALSRSRPSEPARDWFCRMRGDELLAKLLPEVIKRTGIPADTIDDFLVGCATAVGEQWTYGGRIPVFMANLPNTVAAKFVDQQCGSSMAAVQVGFMEIAQEFADIVLCAGYEHMTRVAMGMSNVEKGLLAPNMTLFLNPEYKHWDIMTSMNMGLTAEKLTAQSKVSREEMDRWGARSHQLAAKARSQGFFRDEILPIEAVQADGSVLRVDTDQSVRDDATYEGLAELKPAFKKDGVITPGNSSPLNAGATAMILMSRETARRKGIKPLATIRSLGFAGVDPTVMGAGPVPASRKALEKAGLKAADIDFWEINEAFCIVVLNCIKELGLDPEKVNAMGGGTAI
ncbi:MAG TPA: acetyl-CoA C-acyltransferase, partial [Desulfobacterales bacterium]|nr:acetyl-CoA C-acyltransferase [Desulfobacterales bacterium]